MRLINCKTLCLENDDHWPSGKIPPYAILSHTWTQEGGEVSYQDYLAGRAATSARNWAKIDKTIEITLNQGLSHVWIDACCIDKSSSAELTESINSMFKWYAKAAVCFAHIEGYSNVENSNFPYVFDEYMVTQLKNCRWFSRGWTLQELIAPSLVQFHDDAWNYFGTRDQLSPMLSKITGIDEQVLSRQASSGLEMLRKMTVAKKMSWASLRQTKRVEDRAYSLLGLFDVNMPLLYGEGEKAFVRLQEEILRETNDMTIFAWSRSQVHPDSVSGSQNFSGILAQSPKCFANGSHFIASTLPSFNPECTMTNKGVRIKTQLRMTSSGAYFMGLNCNCTNSGRRDIGILLRYQGMNTYIREYPGQLFTKGGILTPEQTIYLQKYPKYAELGEEIVPEARAHSIRLNLPQVGKYYDRTGISHSEYWYEPEKKYVTGGLSKFNACIKLRTRNSNYEGFVNFVIVCGYDRTSQPWVAMSKRGEDVYVAASNENWDHVNLAQGNQSDSTIFYAFRSNGTYAGNCGLHVTTVIEECGQGKENFSVRVNVSPFSKGCTIL